MFLELKAPYMEILKKEEENEQLIALVDKLSFTLSPKSTFEVPFRFLSEEMLNQLYDKARVDVDRSVMMNISAYKNSLKDGGKISNIKFLPDVIRAWVENDVINRWVFVYNSHVDKYLPYLVAEIKYSPAEKYQERPASVSLILLADTVEFSSKSFTFFSEDVVGKTLSEVLSANKILHEDEELLEEYSSFDAKFKEYNPMYREQFIIIGKLYSGKSYDDPFVAKGVNVVNDSVKGGRSFKLTTSLKYWDDELCSVPIHPFVYVYSLTHYQHLWVHVADLQLYEYDDSLRDKLVLPETHRNLLDILTSNLDVLKGDFIEGKSSGTTILCKGLPGTGKTLTAEVYAELIHRPLFKVNAGQLGTSIDSVEKTLTSFLTLSERLQMVMLIDEADVYIRSRGNDMGHNAVVASFLRTMEYFNGLLFLTTNRVDDVDDAIASRCIASISYEPPKKKAAEKIWKIMLNLFDIEVEEDLVDTLIATFPEASGRDIRELCKLTSRYIKGLNLPADIDSFVSCAQFRAIKIER